MIKLKKTHIKGVYRVYNGDDVATSLRVVKVVRSRQPTRWVVHDWAHSRGFNSRKEAIDNVLQRLVEKHLS